jgi:chromosome segregation ATPase
MNSASSLRNELLELLQKEQVEAISLLDQSPFLTGLVMKYVTGAASRTTISEKNEELVVSRVPHHQARGELERLKEAYKLVVEEAEKVRAEHSSQCQALCHELELLRGESKVQLEKARLQNEQLSQKCDELQDSLAKTSDALAKAHLQIVDMKVRHQRI